MRLQRIFMKQRDSTDTDRTENEPKTKPNLYLTFTSSYSMSPRTNQPSGEESGKRSRFYHVMTCAVEESAFDAAADG